MKVSDILTGAVLALLGAIVLVHVQGYPQMPGQKVGPAVMPGAIAAGLIVCGLLLVRKGWRQRAQEGGRHVWLGWPEWLRSRGSTLAFLSVPAAIVLYMAFAERVGFLPLAVLVLLLTQLAARVRWPRAMLVSVVGAFAIHFVFYKLLKVPLPWGLLQGFVY